MPERIENRMVVDSQWDEIEYGLKIAKNNRIKQQTTIEEVESESIYGKQYICDTADRDY